MPAFQYCLNASTIRTTPILRQIEVAAAAGYTAIELWHDQIDAHLQWGGSLQEIRKAVSDSGLTVPTTIYLKGWFETTGEEHALELVECRRRMEQAAEIGAIHCIAGPPMGHADLDLGAKHYRELLELGLEIGVKPAMEFLGFVQELNTIEGALEVIHRAGHPQGTIVLDPFHIFRGGGSFESVRKLIASEIAICHFNDTPALPPRLEQHDHSRVMPGEGHLDLRQMLRMLRDVGYDRWLSLELFREELWAADPLDVARRGLDAMRSVAESI